jgi:hypothetical protein
MKKKVIKPSDVSVHDLMACFFFHSRAEERMEAQEGEHVRVKRFLSHF